MSAVSPVPSAGSSSAPAVRTSGRSRHKSQRVLEGEESSRALARAKGQQPAAPQPKALSSAARKSSRKGKAKDADDVYCVCKTHRPGAMIECAECSDWFHFDCIDLAPEDAEVILDYRCRDCEAITGKRTSRKYDLEVLGSPTPPPGFPSPPPKKGTKRGKKSKKPATAMMDDASEEESTGTSSDSGSEAAFSDASAAPRRPTSKRRKVSGTPVNLIEASRRAASKKKTVVDDDGPLPPARQYCFDKLVEHARKTFGTDMTDDEAKLFGEQVERAMYAAFKEFVNGKPVAGAKYKAQFSRLNSALTRGLRSSLRAALLDKSLTAAQFGTLTSADLASDSQLEEIQKVQRASLQQSVKEKPIMMSVRVGRDGYEEIAVVDKAEEQREADSAIVDDSAPMDKPETINSIEQLDVSDALNHVAASQAEEAAAAQAATEPEPTLRKPSFTAPAPPVRRPNTFALTSAWGSSKSGEHQAEGQSTVDSYDPLQSLAFGADDTALDLGVFGADETDPDAADVFEEYLLAPENDAPPEPPAPSEYQVFESKPVVWSGKIFNPSEPAPIQPRLEARLISSVSVPLPDAAWNTFLPSELIGITGRVRVDVSVKFLNDCWLNPSKELLVGVFTTVKDASEDEIKAMDDLVQYHINKDRHPIYLPYGHKNIPPGAIKELYLIPLRPSDPAPEIVDLVGGCELPSERPHSIFLVVLIASKSALAFWNAPPVETEAPAISTTPPIPPPAPSVIPSNADLQALMAKLNPAAIKSVLAQGAPVASPIPPSGLAYPPLPPFPPTGQGSHSPYGHAPRSDQHYPGRSPMARQSPKRREREGPHDRRPSDSRQDWDRRRGSDQRQGDRRY